MTPRSSVVAVLLLLLLAIVNSRALQSGPTAQECRHHIEAAIKEFQEGQSEKTETTTKSYEPYTRTQIEDDYATAESIGGDEDQPPNIQEDQHETEDDNEEDEQHIDSAETDHVEDEDSQEREVRNVDEDDGDHSEDDEDEKAPLEEQPSETEEDTAKEPEPEQTEDTDEDDGADDSFREPSEDNEHQQTGQEEKDEAAEEDQEEGAVEGQDQEEAAEETGDDDQETDIHIDGEQADESDEDQTSHIAEGTAETPKADEEDDDDGDSEEQTEDQVEAPPTEEEEHTKDEQDSTGQEGPTVSTDSDLPSTSNDEAEEEEDYDDKNHEDRVKRSEVVEGEDTESEIAVDDDKTEQDEPEDEGQVTTETRTETDDELTTDDQSKDHNETIEETATEAGKEGETEAEEEEEEEGEEAEEEEPIVQGPGELRTRENIEAILALEEDQDKDQREKLGNDVLKEIKRLYENAVRPLEQLYKFKDISTRQMGDAEIFSKPMVLFMGPWSTGKSAIINYLLGTEFTRHALKTGAEPTSNSFTVIMHGDTDQVIDGTQLAADWAFSTLQKFGQTFLDRLRGRRMPNPLLNKITIVDTPGILENRKSIERQYPFNDAFQWFIDRADLIYIVFDPTKLDIGLELEALFDQLKGRENQIRILLNKADIVKPQELMKVQGTLLWNLSPLLGTSEAPTVFVGSLWSRPYLPGSPTTLLDAQEQAFLEDLGETLENRIENKIAQARRHAVRVRNHAKMVDCYLSTYYNHKSFFSNKRKVADDIIDNPQNYQIYEGLSIMTNVSRYDLPDPDIYREFFRIHPLFDFKPLASTCSYFKGCPLDKLDIAIAYDLPELVGKYHRMIGNHPVVGGR